MGDFLQALMMQTGPPHPLGTARNAAIMSRQLDACAELGQHSLAAAKSVAKGLAARQV